MTRRGRVGIGIAVVAAVIVVLVAAVMLSGSSGDAPIGAVAAVQDDHLPVDPVATIPGRLELLRKTGVTTTRVDLFWGKIARRRPADPRNPSDPAYDWTRADLILKTLARDGITPIVDVYDTPSWASGGVTYPRQPWPNPETEFNRLAPPAADFGDFMIALAKRYSGSFTAPGGGALPKLSHFEMWNEPNLNGFLRLAAPGRGALSPRAAAKARLDTYAALDRAGYDAVKAVTPDAVVIAGVAGPRSSTDAAGVGALDWIRGLVERHIPLDAYSQHVYPAAPPTASTTVVPSWATIGRILTEIDAFRPGLGLYITEAGYTTAPTPYRDVHVTEAQQADYLGQIFSLPQLRTERIKAVVWFNLQDNPNWPAGLLRSDLSPKPSYARFADVVKRQAGSKPG